MSTSFNFKSIVVIGSFNPTILTPDFLLGCCEFKSDHKPVGRTTPVASEIVYGSTHFLVELGKFQITESHPGSFEDTFPNETAVRYLDTLRYTPLQLAGLNFNTSLAVQSLPRVREVIGDIWSIGEKLDIDILNATVIARRPNGHGLIATEATLVHMLDADLKNQIRVITEDEKVVVNNNFEIGHLEEDRDRLKILFDKYSDIVRYNTELLKKIEDLSFEHD